MDPDHRLDHAAFPAPARAADRFAAWWQTFRRTQRQTLPGWTKYLAHWPLSKMLRYLKWGLGLTLIALAALAWWYTDITLTAAVKTQMASDLLMHSQRLGKAAPNAIQGNPDAFRQLAQSRSEIDQSLAVLAQGGQWQGHRLPAPDQAMLLRIDAIRSAWQRSSDASAQLLTLEKQLTGFRSTLQKLNNLNPVLLELSEQVATLLAQSGATPREIAAAGQLVMLTQRIGKSANEFLTVEGVSTEAVFLLGKDLNTFREIVDGLVEGNAEIGRAHV